MARKPSQTKERINRCAMELFVEKSIAGTSVRDIAEKAGVADGTLYRHYKSKEDLAWRLFQDNYIALSHILDAVQSKHQHGIAKLQAIIECMGEAFDDDPAFFHYLFLSQHGFSKRLPEDSQTPITVIFSTLETAQKRGEVPSEILLNQAVAVVMGIILQTASFHLQGHLSGSLKERGSMLSKSCWSAIAGLSCEKRIAA